MFDRLTTLTGDEVAEKTKTYLSKEEIKAVMARRDLIVAFFRKQIAAKGEAEVLY
jgi:hypothetical protein